MNPEASINELEYPCNTSENNNLTNNQTNNQLIDVNVMRMIEYYLVKHADLYQTYLALGLDKKYIKIINNMMSQRENKYDMESLENMMLYRERNMHTNQDIVEQIVTTFCLIEILRNI